MKNVVCFGEVLWDMLPSGKKLGGAPLNVALRAQSLGNRSRVISAVGSDEQGKELLEEMKAHQAGLHHIQESKSYQTSEVLVQLDEKGSATYDIKMPCAWDDIQLRSGDEYAVKESDAFIYGSLVARSKTSRNTLINLLKLAPFTVFDVNLRPPHYDIDGLIELMNYAHLIKFNDGELIEICKAMGFDNESMEESVKYISEKTGASQICVTMGDKGGMLFTENQFYYNPGYKVKVADTVGAGDSFLATIVDKLLHNESPRNAIDCACAIGALVASKSGANPEVFPLEVKQMLLTQ